MARTAKVTVIIDDNGTMRLAEKSAKKLGATLDKTGKSTQSVQRGLRGTAEMSSNSTKNFAKQSQVMNGVLVPAYATLAAQVFALTAVFRFFQSAADLRVLTDGQLAYAQATGVSLGAITASLQEATQGQLAFKEAAQAASIGVAAGLDASQLQRLSTVATQASAALGRDLTDSFNRLVKGAIKAEPELLDELGIIVRLQEASENYGRKIGKTANQLSTFEKSQAVVNAVLEQGEEKFGKFEIKVNEVNKAGKAFNDLLIKIQSGLAPFIELLSKAIAESGLFAAAIAGFAFAGPIRSLVPEARDFAQFDRQDIGRSMVGAGYTGEKHQERLLQGTFTSGTLRDIEKSLKATNSKVIDNSENAKVAVKGLAIQARASLLHEAGVMEKGMSGFFKRMEAQFISARGTATGAFASIRAAGTVAFTAIGGAIATAFNIVAIAGLLFTLGQLAFTYFRSKDANAAFNDSLKATTNSLKTQRKEIEKVGASLVASGLTGVPGVIAASNFMRTQTFASISGAAIPQSMIDNISESIDKLEELRKKNKQVQQDIMDGPIFMDKTGAAAMAGLMAAKSEEPLLKNIKLTKNQTAAFMELQKTIGVTSQTLKDSGLTHIPKVNKAYQDMIKLRLEILKISTQEEQTLESLTRLREILNGLNTQGYSFISEEVAQITSLTPVIKSGSDAANEFYKTLIEGTNALSKGDPFKAVRQNILDVRAALVEDLSIQEGMDRPVVQSAENLESIRKIFGASMDGSTTNPGYFIDLLDKLSAKYNTFYNQQFANESRRIRNNTEIASLFENTVDNAKRKAQLQTDNKILDLNDKIGEKLLLASQLRTEGSDVALRHAAILEQDAASMARIIVLSQKETVLKNRLLDIAERKAELDTKATVKTNALKAEELLIDTSIAGAEKQIEQLRLTQAMTAMIIAKERKAEAESLRETSAEHARAADIADSNLKVAVAQVTAVENQNAALVRQRQLQEDLGRIQAKNLQLEGRRLDSQLGPQDSVLGRVRSANLDAEGFRNQAASKRREAQEQNLKQFEKDNLLLEAENLEKRANVAVYEASIQAQASQGLVNSMREGLSDVFTTAAQGGSIKTAMLQFVDSFATTLQDAVVNSLVSSFMESAQIEQAMKSFTDSLFAFISGQGGGQGGGFANLFANLFGGGGGAGGSGGGFISSIVTSIGSFLGFRNGGIISARSGYYSQMYSSGGIAKGRDSGYPAILHGTEAVVPLPDGKKIPVQMQGSNSNVNNISVSVSVDQSGQTSTSVNNADSTAQGRQFGEMISRAIQEELTIQSREGGLLNR